MFASVGLCTSTNFFVDEGSIISGDLASVNSDIHVFSFLKRTNVYSISIKVTIIKAGIN